MTPEVVVDPREAPGTFAICCRQVLDQILLAASISALENFVSSKELSAKDRYFSW